MDALPMIHQKILTPMLPKINVLPVQWSALIGGVVFLFCSFPPLLAQVTLGGEVKAVNEHPFLLRMYCCYNLKIPPWYRG